jgi:predicted RNA methylase
MTADVEFYAELAGEADGPVVELAIGDGRVAVPIARATGRRMIGIDSSPAMLEPARIRAIEAGVDLDLREADMRELRLDEPAALIYCPFGALLHLARWAIAAALSNAPPQSCCWAAGSPGTPWPSTITSPLASTAGTGKNQNPTSSGIR